MALQPFDTTQKLYYPSGQLLLGEGVYDVNNLHDNGNRLYGFDVGDYAYPALLPIPHVEMTLFTFNPAMVTITVYRTAAGRTMPVRGQIRGYAVGGRNVVDWEAPFGIPLTYRAEQFDQNGQSLGFTEPFATQLDVEETWVQNPFDPANGRAIKMEKDAASNLVRPTPTDVHWPIGSGVAVGISSQRRGLVDAPIPFLTFTEEDGDAVRDMLGDPYQSPSVPPVLVIRTGTKQKKMRLPQPFIVLVAEANETPVDAGTGGSIIKWDCTGTEVSPPAPALIAAVLTYADLDAAFATYGARDAAFNSYLAQDRAYQYAGQAEG